MLLFSVTFAEAVLFYFIEGNRAKKRTVLRFATFGC